MLPPEPLPEQQQVLRPEQQLILSETRTIVEVVGMCFDPAVLPPASVSRSCLAETKRVKGRDAAVGPASCLAARRPRRPE